MKNVFDEVYTLDKKCYERFELSEDILMEHAAYFMAKEIYKRFKKNSSILILCGPGNNGADGITLGRILYKDYKINLFIPFGAKSKMSQIQLKRAKNLGLKPVNKITKSDAIVDALFGSGLNKPLDEKSCDIIKQINQINSFKIACDIPSGINIKGEIFPLAFKADLTISMGAYKTPLFSDFAKDYVGKIKVADLGISHKIYEEESNTFLLQKKDLKLPFRNQQNTNKGTFGHTVFIAGEKKGAVIFASLASFAFGSGLCTVVSNDNIILPPEIMQNKSLPKNQTAVVMGMGLGKNYDINIMESIIKNTKIPLVVDADLFSDKIILKILNTRENIVLTPHPKEFASVLNLLDNSKLKPQDIQKDRFGFARDFTKRFKNVTLLLKGSNTLIAQNGKIYINTYGTSALSKGGSGDVLSGMIGALLSQGRTTLEAAISASLAHSLSGKKYKKANYSLSPQDIIKEIKCL